MKQLELIELAEVQREIRAPYQVAWSLARQGELGPLTRVGRTILVERAAVDRYLARRASVEPDGFLAEMPAGEFPVARAAIAKYCEHRIRAEIELAELESAAATAGDPSLASALRETVARLRVTGWHWNPTARQWSLVRPISTVRHGVSA
jgi:hypothetical protein